jgi:threonine synthase
LVEETISTIRQRLACVRCAVALDADAIRCARCGDALAEVVVEGLERGSAPALRARFRERRAALAGPDRSGVWRYRELVHPGVELGSIVTRFEGSTGLYRSPAVASFAGIDALALKHEGENPTGSFKDRGMTVGVTEAVRRRARAVACASTGNTSASLASYAAIAGVPSLVFVPAGKIAPGKLAQTIAFCPSTRHGLIELSSASPSADAASSTRRIASSKLPRTAITVAP